MENSQQEHSKINIPLAEKKDGLKVASTQGGWSIAAWVMIAIAVCLVWVLPDSRPMGLRFCPGAKVLVGNSICMKWVASKPSSFAA
jgi:hypothetical protein